MDKLFCQVPPLGREQAVKRALYQPVHHKHEGRDVERQQPNALPLLCRQHLERVGGFDPVALGDVKLCEVSARPQVQQA